MSDNVIFCDVVTFAKDATLHFPNGECQKIPVAELGKVLIPTCRLGNYSKVKILCDNASYLKGIVEELKIQEIKEYGYNNIEIEVL